MKTKITLLLLAGMLALGALAQTQLKQWYYSGKEVNMNGGSSQSGYPTIYQTITGSTSVSGPTNGIYFKRKVSDESPTEFYISNFTVYGKINNTSLIYSGTYLSNSYTGNTSLTSEISIVPFFSNNNSSVCTPNKFSVFFVVTDNQNTYLMQNIVTVDGYSGAITVTNAGPIKVIQNNDGNGGAIAVSKIVNGKRYLYFASGNGFSLTSNASAGEIWKITISNNVQYEPNNEIQSIGILPGIGTLSAASLWYVKCSRELDLSPDGTKLALGSPSTAGINIYQIWILNSSTGEWMASVNPSVPYYYTFSITGITHTTDNPVLGVEFNASSNILYVSTGSTSSTNDGIYYFDFNTDMDIWGNITTHYIPNSQAYGQSQLELGYTNTSNPDGIVYASSSSGICGMGLYSNTSSTRVLYSSTYLALHSNYLSGCGYLLPDQIDGENYDNVLPLTYDAETYNLNSVTSIITLSHSALPEQPIRIKNNLSITNSGRYYLTDLSFEFGPGATFTTVAGVEIILQNTSLKGDECHQMWQGINLQDEGMMVVLPANNTGVGVGHEPNCFEKTGSTYTSSTYTSFINDAYNAITINGKNSNFSIDGVSFNGNENDIVINGVDAVFSDPNQRSYITNCQFMHNTALNDQTHGIYNPHLPTMFSYLKSGVSGISLAVSGNTNTNINDLQIHIENNLFNQGKYGINSNASSFACFSNIFNDLNTFYSSIGVNATGTLLWNPQSTVDPRFIVNIGSSLYNYSNNNPNPTNGGNTFTNVPQAVKIGYGAASINLQFNIFNSGTAPKKSTVEITHNPNCKIFITTNHFYDFPLNAILLDNNAGNQDLNIKVNNTFINSNQQPDATGITISEDVQISHGATFHNFDIQGNTFTNVAFGIKTTNIVEPYYNLSGYVGIGYNDISNNQIDFYARPINNSIPLAAPVSSDYNTGIQLNNVIGLKVVNNTINAWSSVSNHQNISWLWRNMGIGAYSTIGSLFYGNTIQAGRGISGNNNALDNNYYCNTFNHNVCGFSMFDHDMRVNGDVHGILTNNGYSQPQSRDNNYNNTYPNGSDIEFIFDNVVVPGSTFFSNFFTYLNFNYQFNQNKWVFANKPLVLIFPDPNPNPYFAPLALLYKNTDRHYIDGGKRPNPCTIPLGVGVGNDTLPYQTVLSSPTLPNDTIVNDLFYNWQWAYNYERQIKPLGQVSNLFISNLLDVNQYIAMAKFDSASIVLNTMYPDNFYAANFKTVYQTLLAARYPVIRSFTDSEITVLTNIASQTPYQIGSAIYSARAILWSEAGLAFHDAEPDRLPGIGATIIYSPCNDTLPADLTAQLIDEQGTIYSQIPVMINDDGRIYVRNEYASTLNPIHTYGFHLNYSNTNSGLMTLSQLYQAETNNYYLCSNFLGKKGNDTKPTIPEQQVSATILRVYPNPANNQINIDLPGDMSYTIELYNLVCQKIFSNKTTESFIINSLNFDEGIYIVKITDQNGEVKKTERITIIK